MRCEHCKTVIDKGESYVEWDMCIYCGTSCIVDELKQEGLLEERIREDY